MLNVEYKNVIKKYVLKEKKLLSFIFIVSIVSSVLALMTPRITQEIIDKSLPNKEKELFIIHITILFLAYIFTIICSVLGNYLSNKITENIKMSLRIDMLKSITKAKYETIKHEGLGNVLSKYENEIEIIASNTGEALVQLVSNILSLLLTCLAIYLISWKVFIFTGIVIFLYLINNHFWGEKVNILSEKYMKTNAKTIDYFSDIYNNILNVKIYNLYRKINKKFRNVYAQQYKADISLELTYNLNIYIGALLVYLLIVIVWFVGGNLYFSNNFSIGLIITLTSYQAMLITPINNISSFFNGYKETLVAIDRFYSVINLPKEVENSKKTLKKIDSIRWNNVEFYYENSKNPVLKTGNFSVCCGDVIGLIGNSGGGKSTITKILLRLVDKSGGYIEVNNQQIEDFSITDIRRHIAYLPQDSLFFKESIKENLFLNQERDEDEFLYLCKKLQIDTYINELPGGWNTELQTNGNNLSGGQKKRLDIIRAILTGADVIVFDEPTASLDNSSREAFYELVNSMKNNKIIFIISHNPDEMKYFSKIFWVTEGTIKERIF